MGKQRYEREQPQQRRRGAPNRQLRPLPLGFDAQMGTCFLEGHLQLPTLNKPLYNLRRRCIHVRAKQGLRRKLALRVGHVSPNAAQRVASRCDTTRLCRSPVGGCACHHHTSALWWCASPLPGRSSGRRVWVGALP